jgi:RNA polymerase sigma-70 factor (ECF subfamily)
MYYSDTETLCWPAVVARVKSGDPTGVEDLYAALTKLAGANLLRVVGPQCCQDSLHEIIVIVLEAIQNSELREPERLLGFMRTVARRHMVAHIRGAIHQRERFVMDSDKLAVSSASPEALAAYRERIGGVKTALQQLSSRDQEIIDRFYFREQDREQICAEMRLSDTQFRLYKSRALAKCSRLARGRRRSFQAA